MRVLTVLLVGSVSIVSVALRAQDTHSAMEKRGAMVMGFDQELTVHHFLLFTDGGAIDVGVKDASNAKDRDAIRSHLPHIAMMFGEGNFDAPMLVHDSTNVPGTKVMAARKKDIRFQYVETPSGGRVDISTTEPRALAAVHAFLTFQIADHKTGDPTIITSR